MLIEAACNVGCGDGDGDGGDGTRGERCNAVGDERIDSVLSFDPISFCASRL